MKYTCNGHPQHGQLMLYGWQIQIIYYTFKATFSFHKLIPKNAQMTTLYTNWSLSSLSPWFIILDKNNSVKGSHHYLTSGGYQVFLKPMPRGLIGTYWVKCKQTQV